MRILGIETSSRRGSVALVEAGRLVAVRAHERLNAHAEELLPMLDAALDAAGWERDSLECIAVGVGPGSFTGLRVGIALAQGIAMGLGIAAVGVSSLRCMARPVPDRLAGTRWAVLDARRGEVFCAAYAPDGTQLVAPRAVPRQSATEQWFSQQAPLPLLVVGEAAADLGLSCLYQSDQTDLPHAFWVAAVAAGDLDGCLPATPTYVREPDASVPTLPPDPLASRREI